MLLTIDIGGTFMKYGLMDLNYHLVHTDKIPTPPTIEEFWQGLEELLILFGKKLTESLFLVLVRSKGHLALSFEVVSSLICATFPWLVSLSKPLIYQ